MNEQISEFKSWILSQKIPSGKVEDTGDTIRISTPSATGEVNFHDLDVFIIEMSVDSRADGENKFYLHFEFKDLPSAKENFTAMLRSLNETNKARVLEILFCCTGGLTTGYFAEKLNEASEILARKFEFDAVPAAKVYEVGGDYDIIMIAPQIGYELRKISEQFPDTLVMKIPPKVFAAYDANTLIKFFNWFARYGME
ncbi:MAG: hypothetical protein J5809_06785 [Selenomonadaceae bacterium]|nr:hypothetical protein [Selenomonadaceae bacterium]